MAAITAAREGAQVLLLEKNDRVGKKILSTGNGKCNFTNQDMSASAFYGEEEMIVSVLAQFGLEETLSFFHGIGILPKCKKGYYYPNAGTASSVRNALEAELGYCGVDVRTGVTVTDLILLHENNSGIRFLVQTDQGDFTSNSLLLATGLLAAPKSGSDGSLFPLIEKLGHHFTPLAPALCGFYAQGLDFKKVAGVRTDATVTLYIEGKRIAADTGELQLTDYGLSGIPVFQISHAASLALIQAESHNKNNSKSSTPKAVIAKEEKSTQVSVAIDFLPNLSEQEAKEEILRRLAVFGRTAIAQLNGLLHEKLLLALLKKAQIAPQTLTEDIPTYKKEQFCTLCKDCRVILTQPRGYEFAQVCAGGIRSEEVHPDTLESRLIPGLYFAGELLDVDGICGGYNLQWAWSSAYVAAHAAARLLK